MLTRKIAPALAAGCTIVLKPAAATPMCAIEMFKILHDAGIPKGVANLVTATDPAPTGEEFLSNRRTRKLTFTGSTEVGSMFARGAAATMQHVALAHGGPAPFTMSDAAPPG